MNRIPAHKKNLVLAWLLAGLGCFWLVAVLFPSLMGEQAHFVTGFFVGLLVLSLLRWATRYTTGPEQLLWAWLTIASALGILGNVVWGTSSLFFKTEPGLFSWIDGFYLARYVTVFLALWCLTQPWRWTRWGAALLIAAAAAALLWVLVYRPILNDLANPLLFFISNAMYPVLDPVLLFIAFCAWTVMNGERERITLVLLLAALLCYGSANWINVAVRGADLTVTSFWANLGWGISDLLTGGAALSVIWHVAKKE